MTELILSPPKDTPLQSGFLSRPLPTVYDVLHIDPVSLWINAGFITKLIFCNVKNWEKRVMDTDIANISRDNNCLMRRVSDWQQYVFGPMTKKYLSDDLHMRDIIEAAEKQVTIILNGETNLPSPFDFHLIFLSCLSFRLNSCVEEGIGSNTLSQVKKWFDLMKQLQKQHLFTMASSRRQKTFKKNIDKYINALELNEQQDHDNSNEFMLFHYQSLFIKATYVSFIIIAKPKFDGDQLGGRTLTSSATYSSEQIGEWEVATSDIFEDIFKIKKRGFSENFETLTYDHLPFSEVYERINKDTWKNSTQIRSWKASIGDNSTLERPYPLIEVIHFDVLCQIEGCVEDIIENESIDCLNEKFNLQSFGDFIDDGKLVISTRQNLILEREKSRRNHEKKNVGKKPYQPRKPTFERDMFLLGKMSYFFQDKVKTKLTNRRRKRT